MSNTTKRDDGGPAYPETRYDEATRQEVQWCGMSLRDRIAIAAMQAIFATPDGACVGGSTIGELSTWAGLDAKNYAAARHYHLIVAKQAYTIADAMLAERAKP
jgi:hypothetical protein